MSKKSIWLYSNPTEVYRRARKYIGKTAKIGLSTKKRKKIYGSNTGRKDCSFWSNGI